MEHFQITFMILTSTAGISRFGKKQDLLLVCTKLSQWKPMYSEYQKVACEFSASPIKPECFTEEMESIVERESASFYYCVYFGSCL